MRISHNPPRSRHKRAQWEADRARLERNGLTTESFTAVHAAREVHTTSLRALAFKESVIGRTEFNRKQKPIRRPVQRKADIARNRAALAFARSGDIELFRAIKRN